MSAAKPRAHAVLSASTAKQWLHCPPSARLCETLPDTASDYAEEGRLAHAIAELRLRGHYESIRTEAWPLAVPSVGGADAVKASKRPASAAKTRKSRRQMDKLKAHRLYNAEMEGYLDVYVDHVVHTALALPYPPALDIEARLDFSTWVPQGFGTVDAVLLAPGVLHIHDLKYGKGVPVKAEWNPQMMLYALGAIAAYDFLYDVAEVRMSIVQPRRECISTWSISKVELLRWAEQMLRPAAQLAWEGKGNFHPGQWCRFCRAAATCRARAEAALRADAGHEDHPDAPVLTLEEIGPILRQAQDLARWVKQLEDYALDQCLRGNDIPGLRVTQGRSQRRLDLDRALPVLAA